MKNPYLKVKNKSNELKTIVDLREMAFVEIIKNKHLTFTFKDGKSLSIYFNNSDPSFEQEIVKFIDDFTEEV